MNSTEIIQAAPELPGCYLYKDRMGHVIYVGKAKMLRNRVRSYFRATDDEKVQNLVRQIDSVAFFVTETETDALLHEYRLIKQYKPWFNSQLKRDVPHPLIRLDRRGRYGTLSVAARRGADDAVYFDCFHDEQDARDTLVLLQRVWKTPACGRDAFDGGRACLNYHLGACMAPCEGKADEKEYAEALADIARLFEGKRATAPGRVKAAMLAHAKAMEYEKAEACRQTLYDLERLQRKARRIFNYPKDRMVLVFLRAWREAGFSLFLVRDGAVLAQQRFEDAPDEAGVRRLLQQAFGALGKAAPDAADNWLADAVREIYADKLFVTLPVRCGPAQIEKAINKHFPAFGETL